MVMRFFKGEEFELAEWSVPTPWGGSQYNWAEDFNGDGITDIASALESNLYLHLSDGSRFNTETLVSPGWGESDYNWAGDYNGDGLMDIASAFPGGAVKMRFSNGKGFDEETWSVTTPWGGRGYNWARDFNGDGRTDLAAAQQGNIYLHLSETGEFRDYTSTTLNSWGDGRFNGSGDFNGDGKADIVAAPPDSSDALMRLSTGTGFELVNWPTSGSARPRS